MSTPFSQTMRSLETDATPARLLGFAAVILLLAAWLAWGFGGQITVYEVAQQANLTSDSTVTAHFPPAVQGHIQTGQTARLRLDNYPWQQYGTIPAKVIRVPRTAQDGSFTVQLAITKEAADSLQLDSGMTGIVEVVIETVSPAELLLRTAGRGLRRSGG